MDQYLLARFLHILFAAIWFGLTIGGGQKALWFAREDLGKADKPTAYLIKSGIIGTAVGVLTIFAGNWLVSQTGGWEEVSTPIHVGATLAIAILVIGAWPIGQGWRKLAKERSNDADQATLDAIAKRIGLWDRVVQLLWIIVLATMVFRHI